MQETSTKYNPIGLYYSPESGQYLGSLDEIQSDAFLRVGFKLVKEGLEAAKMTAKEITEFDKQQKEL